MAKLQYKFKSDILFKMFFVKNKDLLRSLVAAALHIRQEDIGDLEITNEAILPELLTSKFCRLDLNMVIDDKRVDLEIQVADEGNFRERAAFYCAKLFAASLGAGVNYKDAPRAILISVVDYDMFSCVEWYSEFALFEKMRHELLCDKMELHFFELRKLPKTIDTEDMLQLWLKIFSVETEEELTTLEKLGVKEVEQAIEAYKYIAGSKEYRELERVRERAQHDEAQALWNSRETGREEGREEGWKEGRKEGREDRSREIASNLVKDGIAPETVARNTGLSLDEVLALGSGGAG
jgi:predicted transposase/invertase (TIGR01784 family)